MDIIYFGLQSRIGRQLLRKPRPTTGSTANSALSYKTTTTPTHPRGRPTRLKVVKKKATQPFTDNVLEDVRTKPTKKKTCPRLVRKTFGRRRLRRFYLGETVTHATQKQAVLPTRLDLGRKAQPSRVHTGGFQSVETIRPFGHTRATIFENPQTRMMASCFHHFARPAKYGHAHIDGAL